MISLSPSSLERIANCPGSYWAEKDLPWKDSPYAAEGNLLHAVMSKAATPEQVSSLDSEQKNAIRSATASGRDLLERHVPGATEYIMERKLQCVLGSDAAFLSGRVDLTAIENRTALVADYKFGRSPEAAAELNWQLGAYALLVKRNHDVDRVVVSIIQPRVELDRRVTEAEYGPDELEAFESALLDVAAEVQKAKATPIRNPGERQCKYCKAAGSKRCPESQGLVKDVATTELGVVLPVGAELGALLTKARAARAVIGLLESHAKEELRAGREVPGWGLTDAIPIRTLPNTEQVWAKVSGVMDAAEFAALCKIGVGDLETELRKKLGWRAKDSRAEFGKLLGDAIVMKGREGSLEATAS